MHGSYSQKQREYRKRVLIAAPIGIVLVSLLFFTSDIVPYRDLEKHIGWQGEIRLLPNITIIPDEDAREEMRRESELRTIAHESIDVVDETGPEKGGDFETPSPDDPEKITLPELDFADVRHHPAHTDVPYTEDYIILHMVQPEYPPRELIDGIEGEVTVEILVNEEGWVENAWVLSAIGPKSFEQSSLAAVRQFRFKPPLEDGEPIQMWIRFHVRFKLVG
jgi:TonB family protein